LSVVATSASEGGLFIEGISGQTSDLLNIQDSASNQYLRVTASGALLVNNNASINNNDGTKVGLTIKAADSQTADLLDLQDSNGTTLLSFSSANSTLTVKNVVITASLTVNGHIISGNSSGSTTAAAGATAGTGATVTITGNDTSGKIVITTGTGAAAGDLADATFANAYSVAPNVVLTAGGANSAKLQYYVTCTTTGFSVQAPTGGTGLSPSTAYTLYYHVIQ
jgi:hypothetical protein